MSNRKLKFINPPVLRNGESINVVTDITVTGDVDHEVAKADLDAITPVTYVHTFEDMGSVIERLAQDAMDRAFGLRPIRYWVTPSEVKGKPLYEKNYKSAVVDEDGNVIKVIDDGSPETS
jgi:hypothetical protein